MTTTTTDPTTINRKGTAMTDTVHRSSRSGLPRIASVTVTTAVALGLAVLFASPAAAADNPLGNVTPTFEFLGPGFSHIWVRVAGSVWMLALAASTVKLISGLYKMRAARAGGYASEMTDAGQDAKVAGVSLAGIAAAGVLVGAILFVVQG